MNSICGGPLAIVLSCASLCVAACQVTSASSTPLAATEPEPPADSPAPTTAKAPEDDCARRLAKVMNEPGMPGAPRFNNVRAEILGRARGEPLFLLREPEVSHAELAALGLSEAYARYLQAPKGHRVSVAIAHHKANKRSLRAIVLREGYLFTDVPEDALAMVSKLSLADLFDDETLFLMRGHELHELRRRGPAGGYVHLQGSLAGTEAELLFGDRLGTDASTLRTPLHRDLRDAADSYGFDRIVVEHTTNDGLVASVRVGGSWARAVLETSGAKAEVACLAEPDERRARIEALRAEMAPYRSGRDRLRRAVGEAVRERLRFDRPAGIKTSERDGELRSAWEAAYRAGHSTFHAISTTLPVFTDDGRPSPPEVCAEFVVDSFERAAGTWYAPRGQPPQRVVGGIDFRELGMRNRQGVLALARYAEERPDIFHLRTFRGDERIRFLDRGPFFRFLVEHSDAFRPGDIVAIQGLKRDGKIHQHAILIEYTDPITGFPHGLADQMSRARRRTWEGIMAEAPLRSLLYRIRPTARVLGAGSSPPDPTESRLAGHPPGDSSSPTRTR